MQRKTRKEILEKGFMRRKWSYRLNENSYDPFYHASIQIDVDCLTYYLSYSCLEHYCLYFLL